MLLDRLVSKSYDQLYTYRPTDGSSSTSSRSDDYGSERSAKQTSQTRRIVTLFRGRQHNSNSDEKDIVDENIGGFDHDDHFTASDGCPSLSHALDGFYSLHQLGKFMPKYPQTYACVVRLEAPQSPSDPNHFGHVAWTYCTMFEDSTES
jgi:hypothetical protein